MFDGESFLLSMPEEHIKPTSLFCCFQRSASKSMCFESLFLIMTSRYFPRWKTMDSINISSSCISNGCTAFALNITMCGNQSTGRGVLPRLFQMDFQYQGKMIRRSSSPVLLWNAWLLLED
jgi:hypothetical protein